MKKTDKFMILIFFAVLISIFSVAGLTAYRYVTYANQEGPNLSDGNNENLQISDTFIAEAINAGNVNDFTKEFILPKISEENAKDVNFVLIGTPYYKIALQAYININKYGESISVDQVRAKFDELEINQSIFFTSKFNSEYSNDSRMVLIQNDEVIMGEALESEDANMLLVKFQLSNIDLTKSAILRVQDRYNESLYDDFKVDFTKYR